MTPYVVAVCLTADRQKFTERALACFAAQTYPNKGILVLDNGREPFQIPELFLQPWLHCIRKPKNGTDTVGSLRNLAAYMATSADILMHWDSDDWSHPQRMASQVKQLQDKPVVAVGYRSLVFWRSTDQTAWVYETDQPRYCIGTSLAYWRSTWSKKPFASMNVGEDTDWQRGLKTEGVPGFLKLNNSEPAAIIAELHGANTNKAGVREPSFEWRRVPLADDFCRERMKL